MPKITFIGGGSAKFVAALARDLFSFQELQNWELCLMDVNPDRVARSEQLVRRIIREQKLPATVTSTTDQRKAIAGSDYVIITVMVGGFKHYGSDNAIPIKYGVLTTVGDTSGPGAVFRLVRTAPVVEEIVRNVKETAPNAWIFNYTNPMAMVTGAFLTYGHPRTVGLCHSIQAAYREIAEWVGVPWQEVLYTAGGINHINYYLSTTHKGRDLYQMLMAKREEMVAKYPHMRLQFELLESVGGWTAEEHNHQAEYYPWFRKNPQVAEDHYAVKTNWGYHYDMGHNEHLEKTVQDQIDGRVPIDYKRSLEYGAWMVHAIETNEPLVVYGNVRNCGLIENLPSFAVVEVPCLVSGTGVAPCHVGAIPLPMASVMSPHVFLHEMAVQGVVNKDRRMIYQAVQADPLTNAALTLPQIKSMVDELFVENKDYMKGW